MKESYNILYRFTLLTASLIALFAIYTDIGEVFNRMNGRSTVMSQISWFSDDLAIIYCSLSGIFFVVYITILLREVYLKKNTAVIITAIVIIVSFIIQLFLEQKYIYYQPI